MTDKKEFDMTDIGGDIASEWKNVNWDLVQRMRFMNADAEIDPEDSYSKGTTESLMKTRYYILAGALYTDVYRLHCKCNPKRHTMKNSDLV